MWRVCSWKCAISNQLESPGKICPDFLCLSEDKIRRIEKVPNAVFELFAGAGAPKPSPGGKVDFAPTGQKTDEGWRVLLVEMQHE